MAALGVGRVCMKISGREAGRYCVVLKTEKDKAFVWITGPKLLTGVKRRRCNVEHLEPTPYMVEIKEDSTEEEVIDAFEKAGLVTKLNLKKPSAAEVKAEKEKPEKTKEERPKKKEEKKEKKKA